MHFHTSNISIRFKTKYFMRNIIKKTLFVFDHIHAGGGGGQFPPPLLYSKSIGLRLLKFFFTSLTHAPPFRPKRGFYIYFMHTAWMPYFTITRLNLYFDQLPVIGFRLVIALWKALTKRKQIAQFSLNTTREVRQQIWVRSVQTFWRLLYTSRQTNRQAKYIYIDFSHFLFLHFFA